MPRKTPTCSVVCQVFKLFGKCVDVSYSNQRRKQLFNSQSCVKREIQNDLSGLTIKNFGHEVFRLVMLVADESTF